MDKLQAMQLFRRVAELGSFRRAADELDLSASYVSRRVGQLEQELGGRLMTRTTRQLALTETGAAYLEHCGFGDVVNLSGGIDAWARTVDPAMAVY